RRHPPDQHGAAAERVNVVGQNAEHCPQRGVAEDRGREHRLIPPSRGALAVAGPARTKHGSRLAPKCLGAARNVSFDDRYVAPSAAVISSIAACSGPLPSMPPSGWALAPLSATDSTNRR